MNNRFYKGSDDGMSRPKRDPYLKRVGIYGDGGLLIDESEGHPDIDLTAFYSSSLSIDKQARTAHIKENARQCRANSFLLVDA